MPKYEITNDMKNDRAVKNQRPQQPPPTTKRNKKKIINKIKSERFVVK